MEIKSPLSSANLRSQLNIREKTEKIRETNQSPSVSAAPYELKKRQFKVRSAQDRRKKERRVKQIPVLLDTRNGRDRRLGARRKEDIHNTRTKVGVRPRSISVKV